MHIEKLQTHLRFLINSSILRVRRKKYSNLLQGIYYKKILVWYMEMPPCLLLNTCFWLFFSNQLSNYLQQCLVLRVRFHQPKLQSINIIKLTGLNKKSNRCKDVSSTVHTWSEKTVLISIVKGEDEQQEPGFLLCAQLGNLCE